MMSPEERRSYPRHERRDIRVTLLDPLDRVIDEKTVLADISQGGAGLTTRAKLLAGETVKFQVHLPRGRTAFGHGKVRWVAEPSATASRQIGVEFIDFGWGGFGRLQEALGGAPDLSVGSDSPALDALLMGACAVVGFLLFRASFAHPAAIDGNLPALAIGGAVAALNFLRSR